jgi:ADP-ribose pyrophosphatase
MEIEKVQVITKSPHLHMNCSHYTDKNGKGRLWYWVERPHKTHAVMIAAMHGDKLVVIKEYRVPDNCYVWSFPAGLVEHNEDVEKAAEREMIEETGLTIINYIRSTGPMVYTSPGITNEKISMVFAKVEGVPDDSLLEESEEISVHLMSRTEVASLLQRNNQIDSKAYLVMLRYAEDGKI